MTLTRSEYITGQQCLIYLDSNGCGHEYIVRLASDHRLVCAGFVAGDRLATIAMARRIAAEGLARITATTIVR